ncbi:hypothetical protein BBO_09150 [Beauveria brongniartii RCEF 3172]|uniref:Uncharacterized protein n=1 Tax=Beauveria brongniartii RCEF 3172 TaxID=1081107 RepID=A0A166WCK2_9HYPO|nr:hypothetical protein BBO_09150 [Beauveria brongniartii RCEF 3172]
MESPKVTKGSETHRSTIEVKVDFSVLLDDHPKAADKPKLPTLCTQYAPGLDEGPDSSKHTACSVLGVKQTSITLDRDSMAVTKANQTIKPARPNKKQPEKNECIGMNRGGRHRQTVASSWRDVDMAALAKIASGDGEMPSIGPNRPKVATTAQETQSKECFEAAMILEVALAQATSQLESYPYGQPHPKLAPQLRLRRKELIDADDTPTTEAGGCARGSSSADAYSSAYSTPSVLPFKGIFTLFQAIFGIVVLGCRTTIIIVVRWWMPVEETGSKTGVPALSVDGHDAPVFLNHNAKY